MAHLGTNYTSFSNFIDRADAFWTVDFETLNSSGVTGTGVLAVNTEEDGTRYLNVSIAAKGLTPDVQHAQHIHGLFDDDGNPIDSQTPTIADDADRDGMVEVLEGFGQYGDIILTLLGDGELPTASADGELNFIQNYDLGNDELFFSPFGNDYTSEDLMPLELREIVIHGQNVPSGIGAGTEGEINGDQDGFVGILPVLAGEIVSVDQAEAFDVLEDQIAFASKMTTLTEDADTFEGGLGGDTVLGLGGDDTISGGSEDDFIDGGEGADSIDGGVGADTLLGGAGDDMLVGQDGADVLSGGTGNDSVMAGDDDTNAENAADMSASGALTIDDYDNAYAGGAGDDMLMGGAGDDIITGDDESRVATETGEMFDMAADGADTIFGGAGNDEIHTGTWADGDDGFDNTHMGEADDFASGGEGNDILIGDNGDDTLQGDEGNDTIKAGGGADDIEGGEGDDTIDGGAGADTIDGGMGADTLAGGADDDMLTGQAGADVLSGGAGNDSVMAGDDDTNEENAADAAASGALTIDDYDNAYAGGAGDDVLIGGAGDDIITGDDESRVATETGETFDMTADGADIIFGGAGNDEIHTGTWADGDDGFDNTHMGAADDFAAGGAGNDILIGDNGNDTLRGDTGEDTIKAGGGDDFVGGGTGNDNLDAGAGTDSVYAGSGDDLVLGGTGGDLLVGQDGNDVLSGGAGTDMLVGGDGDDFINGGFANDRINTGEGADKVFHAGVAGHGTDFVQDFDGENDIFVFGGSAEATADDFLVQTAIIENAGADDVAEAFITYVPTGQVLWTAIDGDALETINVMAGGEVFDLLA